MNIELWSIGKANDSHINEGVNIYLQKLKQYCPTELVIIPPSKKAAKADAYQTKLLEEELILKRLQPHHYLILLDERGKLYNSIEWSTQFQQLMNMGTKTVVILIGGAFGVSDNIKEQAKQTWSLSKLVFPHQLVRLMLAEQVYRAFSILHNSPYHHI
ncbi:MAG: 23S rRNA (pseudouridine(1915)-N(3))-methyltransferase RlmH [Flavipsychrobacter sp.]